MAALIPSPVDVEGNISFIRGEGLNIPIREIQDDGTPVSLVGADRQFFINGIPYPLIPDPDYAPGLRLIIQPESLDGINGTVNFTYLDNDGPTPISLWEGALYRRSYP